MESTTTAVLTPEDHERFIRDGFVIVRQLVPRELVERTVELLEEIGPRAVADRPEPPLSDLLAECVEGPLFHAVAELMGPFKLEYPIDDRPRPQQLDKEWSIEGPHVDFFSEPDLLPHRWGVSVFLALTRMPSRGGAFMYAPGSPIRFQELASRRGSEWVWTAATRQACGEVIEFLPDPGDAIFFHPLISHSASLNVSNPQTRHQLDVRCQPADRVRPGDKAFDEMSTLEKSCSMRYLASHVGADVVLPPVADDATTAETLSSGFGATVRAQVAFRWDGATYTGYVLEDDPATIRLARTTDWSRWDHAGVVASPIGSVQSLHFDARYGPTLTLAGATSSVILHGTDDLTSWTTIVAVDDMHLSRQRYTAPHFNRPSHGQVVIYVDPSSPHEVRWRSPDPQDGDNKRHLGFYFRHEVDAYADLAAWPDDGVACSLPAGTVIDDVVVGALTDVGSVALIADLRDAPARFVRAQWNDEFGDELRPLGFDTPTPPHRIRVYERATGVWLVTYLREGRVFWGTIDWTAPEPAVAEIRTGAQLRSGLADVGLL